MTPGSPSSKRFACSKCGAWIMPDRGKAPEMCYLCQGGFGNECDEDTEAT